MPAQLQSPVALGSTSQLGYGPGLSAWGPGQGTTTAGFVPGVQPWGQGTRGYPALGAEAELAGEVVRGGSTCVPEDPRAPAPPAGAEAQADVSAGHTQGGPEFQAERGAIGATVPGFGAKTGGGQSCSRCQQVGHVHLSSLGAAVQVAGAQCLLGKHESRESM